MAHAEPAEVTEPRPTPSLARSTALMSFGTVISRVTGVIRLAVLAATLGVVETRLTDTYNLANSAPNILYELVLGGVVTSVFVPVFVELLEKEDRERAWRSMNAILNLSLLALTAVALIGVLAAPLIAAFYSSRLTGAEAVQQQAAITFLLRLFIPQVVLYGVYFMGSAMLNAHKRFVLPMYTPILNNVVLIVVLVVFARLYSLVDLESVTTTQLLLLGLGTTASVAPMGLALLPSLRSLGGYRFTLKADPQLVRRLGRLSVFVIGFVAANQVGYLVVQWLANGQQGGFTAYVSAFTFFLLPVGLFVWSLTTALAPSFSRHAVNERWQEFRDDLSVGIRATLFLMLPSAVGSLVLARPLVEILLEHGVVTESSTVLIVDVLRFFMLGLVQFSLFQMLVRAFYALQDSKTPFLINVAVVGLNIAINVPMYAWLGVEGLAAGLALAYTGGVVLQARLLSKRAGKLEVARMGRTLVRLTAAVAGMAVLVWIALQGMERVTPGEALLGQLLRLAVPTAVGAASYLGLAMLLRVEEVAFVRNVFGRRLSAASSSQP